MLWWINLIRTIIHRFFLKKSKPCWSLLYRLSIFVLLDFVWSWCFVLSILKLLVCDLLIKFIVYYRWCRLWRIRILFHNLLLVFIFRLYFLTLTVLDCLLDIHSWDLLIWIPLNIPFGFSYVGIYYCYSAGGF